MSFRIAGTGSAMPEFTLYNEDFESFLDTNNEWIYSRTGIKSRPILTEPSIVPLAVQASASALQNANALPSQIQLIICATVSNDYLTPSLACLVQSALGANCPAFDLNAACTGFIYALEVANGFISHGFDNVLVIGIDAISRFADWTDRSTCILFGDGGGAVLLKRGSGRISSVLSSSGNADILSIPQYQTDCPFKSTVSKALVLQMSGREVFKFAVNALCDDLEQALKRANLNKNDLSMVIPHQANRRIIEAAAVRLGLPLEKVICMIDYLGNMSAGSLPVVLDRLNKSCKLQNGDFIALCAFGGGMTSGCIIIKWNR